MKPPIPTFTSDDKAERFVESADLSAYDLSGGTLVTYELQPKSTSISLRLPQTLLAEVRRQAKRAGVPYQRFVRLAIERAVREGRLKG